MEVMRSINPDFSLGAGGNVDQRFASFLPLMLEGHFQRWVLECGKPLAVYEKEFGQADLMIGELKVHYPPAKMRLTPGSIFKNEDGRECRQLEGSTFKEGQWKLHSELLCRNSEGSWQLWKLIRSN
jgi:hypothetical protein